MSTRTRTARTTNDGGSGRLVEVPGEYWEEGLRRIRDLSWTYFDEFDAAIGRAGEFLSGFESLRRAGWDVEAAEMMWKRSEVPRMIAERIGQW